MGGEAGEATTFANLIAEGALEIGDGYRAKNEELGGDGLRFLRAGHVTDTHIDFDGVERFHTKLDSRVRSKLAKAGDAVITTKGNSTGRTTFVSPSMPPFVYSPHLSYWRSLDTSRVEGGFLRYWCKSAEFKEQLAGMKSSTDMAPYLSLVDQRRLRITLLPIAEQRAIAHILGALDDKIDLNRRTSETLEAMARALFKSWFVDFDPVRAKAEGREPGLPGHVGGLFPAAFDDSEMGRVPRGWTVGSLLTQATLLSGGTPRTDREEYWNGKVPWASAKDVSQCGDSFLLGTERTITGAGLSESATQLIPAYATAVVARGATTGRMVLFGREMAMNQTCYALVSTEGTPFALHCLLRNSMDSLVRASHGSVFDTITTSTFNACRVMLAPVEIRRAFETLVSPGFLRIRKNSLESRTLTALRDTLLPRLISGELRIPDAERIVGEVA